jgi:hypothetical protein
MLYRMHESAIVVEFELTLCDIDASTIFYGPSLLDADIVCKY